MKLTLEVILSNLLRFDTAGEQDQCCFEATTVFAFPGPATTCEDGKAGSGSRIMDTGC